MHLKLALLELFKAMAFTEHVNILKWIEKNEPSFAPPVCNKLMSGGQLKVMFIGGPNVRKDFHINEGEELFYMVRGDMVLRVMEHGAPKDIEIREGEIFLLPGRIPHSPQRQANTVGLVIERERLPEETDGLRYYQSKDEKAVLWEKWFHCDDLGTQLGPIIKEYFASDQHQTGKPKHGDVPGAIVEHPPVNLDTTTTLPSAFSLQKWINEHEAELASGSAELFNQGETKVMVYRNTTIKDVEHAGGETWLWQVKGEGTVTTNDTQTKFGEHDSMVILPNQKFSWALGEDDVGMAVTMLAQPRA